MRQSKLLQQCLGLVKEAAVKSSGPAVPVGSSLPLHSGFAVHTFASRTLSSSASDAAIAASITARPVRSWRAWLKVYKQLSKARLSALVVATAGAGFVAGSGEHIEWGKFGWTAVGTMACAASANALNQASLTCLVHASPGFKGHSPLGSCVGPHTNKSWSLSG